MQNLSARNPLGIIALFISLIYGICALLLGVSVDRLDALNQERLVWFIILFPVGILSAFVFLVTKHHQKLYGPGDFRTDEGFLSAADPRSVGEKYLQEAIPEITDLEQPAEGAEGEPAAEADAPPDPAAVDSPADVASSEEVIQTEDQKVRYVSELYLLEGLALEELQQEFGAPARRDVTLSPSWGHRVDAIIETGATPIIVEVKIIGGKSEFNRRIRDGLESLRRSLATFRSINGTEAKGILAVIVRDPINKGRLAEMRQAATMTREENGVRIFQARELLKKYGFLSGAEA